MPRLFSVTAAMFLSLLGPALCAADAGAADLDVLYSASNLINPVQRAFKQRFESTHAGARVSLEPTLEYNDTLAIALRQSLIGAGHDVGYYGVSDLCLLAERGIAKPIDALIESDPQWRTLGIPEKRLGVTRCNGATYGIPFSASFMVVLFNKTLVAQAGGDPARFPRTWPDILDLARKIKARSGGIAMNYEGSSSWSFMTLVLSRGGSILSADGKDIAFDSKEGLEALQILAGAGAARDHADLTKSQARQAFVSGALGILVDSSSGIAEYKKNINGVFEMGIVPYPVAPTGGIPASGMASVLQASSPEKQKLAWDYMKDSASPDGQTVLGKMTGFLPFNEIAIQAPDKLGDYYAQNPEIRVAAESLDNAVAWPSFPGPNGLKIHQIIMGYMQKVYNGAMAPDAALAGMARDTRALLR
ncbi:extracellular solute-binding protein [Labrys wisconsinensis]|uniref:Multiple sugar transport system substrate-binding protein n=1 Tax=Labrys wisconsinensis TaxID=425677 RepID=A0ABU0JEF0_9HYPH|nr:extracellular solute-binding protein [Labrys wisconsinensis]MDQ0472654.1 multiple sugar transport system substrate-binding protein [Labrys wisconsinensis]